MKKITFLIAALLLMVTNMVSQNIIIEREDANDFGIGSTEGNDGAGTFVADQFVLTGETTLGSLEVIGITSGSRFIRDFVLGVNVFIYEDVNDSPAGNPTLPGTGVIELGGISPSNFTIAEPGNDDSDFMINLEAANGGELTLGAGTYWLSVSPVVSTLANGSSGTVRWNWSISSTNNTPNIATLIIDPEDIFSTGNTDWTNAGIFSDTTAPAMAWTLYDQAILSTEDNVIEGLSISPNPTNGVVNFNLPGDVQLDNIRVYDISGRQVINSNSVNTIDLTNYSKGVYVAKLTTANGLIQSARIVKQ